MIFPLLKFWTYTPLGFLAAIVWNVCELLKIPAPKAHILFGLITNSKPVKRPKPTNKEI